MSELRELDVEIGKAFFGIKKPFKPLEVSSGGLSPFGSDEDWHYIPSGKPPRTHMIDSRPLPRFSSNVVAAFQVEDRIAELGLKHEYVVALAEIITNATGGDCYEWHLIHASPEQRCRAALECVKEKAEAAGA